MNPQDKQPYQYTRGDLERYIAGKMSPAEMHLLEKAALDDPFLSEALEGMLDFSGTDMSKDLQSLDEQIADKISSSGIRQNRTDYPSMRSGNEPTLHIEASPLPAPGNSDQPSYPMYRRRWFRVAAAALFLLGFATITLYLLRSDTQRTIASMEKNEPQGNHAPAQPSGIAGTGIQGDTAASISNPVSPAIAETPEPPSRAALYRDQTNATSPENKKAASGTGIPDSVSRNAETFAAERPSVISQRDVAAVPKAVAPFPAQDNRRSQEASGYPQKSRARNVQEGITEKMAGPYVFTGQVVDPEGKPISFVNLRIRNSAASAYSDARGNYRIVSGDSSLQVELKAYGFQGRSIDLSVSRPRQVVRLQPGTGGAEAGSVRPKASAKEEMTKMDEDSTADAENPEAEPSDGWGTYQYYLLNNLRMPQDAQQQKLRGTVDISFLVAENGRLSDFRIEKSLSTTCDREAIRLVREGPAWTLYNSEKPLRARVTVVF